ncbi:MAG: translocation/assembly module TamB domain-containing protein [Nitrospirota bacterium]|nr:translocation/assembly module TamB domain-containing protein [Nitrospirota bacterium]
MERVRLSLFPPSVNLHGVKLPAAGNTFSGGGVERIRVKVSPWSLLAGGLRTLDVTLWSPTLRLEVEAPALPGVDQEGAPDKAVRQGLASNLGVLAGHHLRVLDGTLHMASRGKQVTVWGVEVETEPDVTLRYLNLMVSTGVVQVGNTELLSMASLEGALDSERLRVAKARFEALAGNLEMSGEVRMEAQLVAALRTLYDGRMQGAAALVRRFGINAPEVTGTVHAEGRLYGNVDDLHWDGELKGADLQLEDDPHRLPSAEMRLRLSRARVEVVHARASVGEGEVRAKGGLALDGPPEYDLDGSLDNVSVAWLGADDLLPGTMGGDFRVRGTRGERLQATGDWRFENGGQEDLSASDPVWRRILARLTRASGHTEIAPDGGQRHTVHLVTGKTDLHAKGEMSPGRQLNGHFNFQTSDFADLGELFGLPYVHGTTMGEGVLSGTRDDFRLTYRSVMEGGRAKNLVLGRVTADMVLTPEKLTIRHLNADGDGRIRLDGEVRIPPKGQPASELGVNLAASLDHVPLTPLAELFYTGEDPLETDFPVTGDVHVINSRQSLAAWSLLTGGAGTFYGQDISDARADVWIDHKGMKVKNARFGIPSGTRRAEVTGDAAIEWERERFEVSMQSAGLPVQSTNLFQENAPYMDGTYMGDAHLSGDFEAAILTARGRVRDFTLGGMPVGDGDVDVVMSPWWQLRVRATLDGEGGADNPAKAAWVNYYAMLDRHYPFHLATRIGGRLPMVPWLREFVPDADASFREQLGEDYRMFATGRAAMSGTVDEGATHAVGRFTRFDVETGELVASLTAPVVARLEDNHLSTEPMTLVGDGLTLAVSGGMTLDESFDLYARGVVEGPWFRQLKPDWGVISGETSFDVHVYDDWVLTRVKGFAYPNAMQATPVDMLPPFAAITVTGQVEMDGPLEDPMRGDVDARLGPVALTVFGSALTAPQARVKSVNGVYLADPVELTGPMGQLRVEGGWEYEKSVQLKAVGSLDLARLTAGVDGLEQGVGTIQVTMEQTGGWDISVYRGGATLEKGRVHVDALGQTLQVDFASVLVDDTRILIDTLEARMGGGTLTAQGVFDTATLDGRLLVEVDQYTVQPVAGLSATVGGQFILEGKYPAPTLSGDVRVHKALYDRSMQWGDWMASGAGEQLEESGPLGDTRLAVHVYGDRNLFVDNNLAEMALDMDLMIGGTVASPSLLGQVDSRGGTVKYREHVFEVQRASVEFVTEGAVDPYLDMVARTTVQHALPDNPLNTEPIEVEVTLSGRVEDQMDLTLTSRPELPQADLISLLAVGMTADELTDSGAQTGLTEAISLATGPMQAELQQQLHRIAGIDRFQVDPFYDDASASSSARVTVGKSLFDSQAQITYSTVLDATQEPIIQFSYRLGPRMSLMLEQDEEGRRGGEVRFRVRFR